MGEIPWSKSARLGRMVHRTTCTPPGPRCCALGGHPPSNRKFVFPSCPLRRAGRVLTPGPKSRRGAAWRQSVIPRDVPPPTLPYHGRPTPWHYPFSPRADNPNRVSRCAKHRRRGEERWRLSKLFHPPPACALPPATDLLNCGGGGGDSIVTDWRRVQPCSVRGGSGTQWNA